MHFFFLRSMYRMGTFLGVAKISNTFWGMPDIPDIFFWKQMIMGPSLCMKKKLEYPPPPLGPYTGKQQTIVHVTNRTSTSALQT